MRFKKKLIERKLKNRKFCRGVQISEGASKSAKTLRQFKFLKKSTDNCSVGIVVKTYLWLSTGIPVKNELFPISLTQETITARSISTFQKASYFESFVCYLFICPKRSVLYKLSKLEELSFATSTVIDIPAKNVRGCI